MYALFFYAAFIYIRFIKDAAICLIFVFSIVFLQEIWFSKLPAGQEVGYIHRSRLFVVFVF